jgi:hypothetical protein
MGKATKRGKPADAGERFPCGRKRPTDFRSDSQIRRIVQAGLEMSLDPVLGSQAGILRMRGKISDKQLSTVEYIGRVYGRFEWCMQAPLRRTKSPSYDGAIRAARADQRDFEEVAQEASAEFNALQNCIPVFPREAREVIESLCVDDQHVPDYQLEDLKRLLDRIAVELRGEAPERSALSRGDLPLRRRAGASRQEKFETGVYAYLTPGTRPAGSEHHVEGSQAERDRAETVRRLEEVSARMEATG